MKIFYLFDDYITLGQFLKEFGLINTGGQAKHFLAEHEGKIFYNAEAENRRGKKLYAGDLLEIPSFDLKVTFERASQEKIEEKNRIKILEKAANTPLRTYEKAKKPKSPFQK